MTSWQAVARTEDPSKLNKSGVPSFTATPQLSFLRPIITHATFIWKWIEQKRTQQISARRLKVTETVSLGEKRFVSILQVDGAQFLIGGSSANVSLLAILDKKEMSTDTPWRQAPASAEMPS
jgi:flagellar biogenesis protein FliO